LVNQPEVERGGIFTRRNGWSGQPKEATKPEQIFVTLLRQIEVGGEKIQNGKKKKRDNPASLKES